MIQSVAIDKKSLQRSIYEECYYDFFKKMWSTVVQEKYHDNWHIELLCEEIQKSLERVFEGKPKKYDLIINISPGSTKSLTCTVMSTPWAWTRMPTFKSINGSHAHSLALNLSRLSRQCVKSDEYQELWPLRFRDDQDAKGFFVNEHGGHRFAVGTGGVTGFHGHAIFIDDPIDPMAAYSEVETKAANDWVEGTIGTRKIDKAVTPIIMIMQRLSQADPAGTWLEKGGKIRHISLPADFKEGYEVKPKALRRKYKDGLMDPKRFSRSILQEEFIRLGEHKYAGQFGQSPIPIGGAMFKVDRLLYAPAEVQPVGVGSTGFKRLVRYWDNAGTLGGGAYTSGTLLGWDQEGRTWVLDQVRGQWDSDKRESIKLQVARMDGTGVQIGQEQEPGSGGKEQAQNTVRRLAGFRVKIDNVGQSAGNKAVRADPFSTQVNAGNVIVYEDTDRPGYKLFGTWARAYVDEMRYFPYGKYKDQIDSSSGAYNMGCRRRITIGAL